MLLQLVSSSRRYSTRALRMWGTLGAPDPTDRPRPKPLERDAKGRLIKPPEFKKIFTDERKRVMYTSENGPEPLFVKRLPDRPIPQISPENLRPGMKWIYEKKKGARKIVSPILQVNKSSPLAPMVEEALDYAEMHMRDEMERLEKIFRKEQELAESDRRSGQVLAEQVREETQKASAARKPGSSDLEAHILAAANEIQDEDDDEEIKAARIKGLQKATRTGQQKAPEAPKKKGKKEKKEKK